VLVPASDDSQRGALARVERLERRIGVAVDSPVAAAAPAPVAPPVVVPTPQPSVTVTEVQAPTISEGTVEQEQAVAVSATAAEVTFQQVKDSWPEILEAIAKAKRSSWLVVSTSTPIALREGNILDLTFASQKDVDALKQRSAPGEGVADHLKQAVVEVLGFRPLLTAKVEATREAPAPVAAAAPAPAPAPADEKRVDEVKRVEPVETSPTTEEPPLPDEPPEPDAPDEEPALTWATATIADSEPETRPAPAPVKAAPAAKAPAPAVQKAAPSIPVATPPSGSTPADKQRYGEAVVREILGASFIEEQAIAPRVVPREQ
jgi:DNA polymerase-3 subunit gamma/tau